MENGEDRVQASVGPLRAALNSWVGGRPGDSPPYLALRLLFTHTLLLSQVIIFKNILIHI